MTFQIQKFKSSKQQRAPNSPSRTVISDVGRPALSRARAAACLSFKLIFKSPARVLPVLWRPAASAEAIWGLRMQGEARRRGGDWRRGVLELTAIDFRGHQKSENLKNCNACSFVKFQANNLERCLWRIMRRNISEITWQTSLSFIKNSRSSHTRETCLLQANNQPKTDIYALSYVEGNTL